MGDAKATVRIDAKTDGFKRGMKEAEKAATAAGAKGGSAFSKGLSAGAKGGMKAITGVFSQAKQLAGQIGGLLGGIGFASLAKGAIDAQRSFKQLAFSIELSSGKAVRWQALQAKVQKTALAAKVDINKLGEGFKVALQETGDLALASDSLEAIAIVGKKTGAEFATLGKLSGVLKQKFGLANAEIGDGLLQLVSSAAQGGASIEDLADDFAEVGGKAKTLGLQGPEGIRKMVGFLNIAKRETGNFNQAMTALPQVFDQIIERTSKGVIQSGGKIPIKIQAVDKNGKPRDPFAIIQDILSKTKGDAKKLGEFGFGGEGLQTLLGLAKPFAKELQATGKLTKLSSEAFQAQLTDAAGSTKKFSDVAKEGGEPTAAENLQDAINRLQIAFTKPEMIGALEKMAAVLPRFATALASVMTKVLDNPALSAGVFLGAKSLSGGLGAGLAGIAGGGGAAGGGGGAAALAMKTAMSTGGKTAATSIGGAFLQGSKQFGGAFLGAMAPAAAAFATAMAVDQAGKLVADIRGRSAQRRDFERIEAKQKGEKTFTSQRSLEERALSFFTKTGGDRFRDLTAAGATEGRVTATGERGNAAEAIALKLGQDFDPSSKSARRDRQDADIERSALAGEDARRFAQNRAFAERKIGRKLSGSESETLQSLSGKSKGVSAFSPSEAFGLLKSEQASVGKATVSAIAKIAPALASAGMRISNPEEVGASISKAIGTAPGATPRQ